MYPVLTHTGKVCHIGMDIRTYGPYAELSGCVNTGFMHIRVANFQSGMVAVIVSSESGLSIQPA